MCSQALGNSYSSGYWIVSHWLGWLANIAAVNLIFRPEMLAERRPHGHLAHNQPHSPPAVRCCGVRSVRRNASPVKAVAPCRGRNKTSLRACQPFSLRWLVNRKRHGDSFWPGSFILIQSIQSMSIVVTSCTASIPSLQLDYHFEISKDQKKKTKGGPIFSKWLNPSLSLMPSPDAAKVTVLSETLSTKTAKPYWCAVLDFPAMGRWLHGTCAIFLFNCRSAVHHNETHCNQPNFHLYYWKFVKYLFWLCSLFLVLLHLCLFFLPSFSAKTLRKSVQRSIEAHVLPLAGRFDLAVC